MAGGSSRRSSQTLSATACQAARFIAWTASRTAVGVSAGAREGPSTQIRSSASQAPSRSPAS